YLVGLNGTQLGTDDQLGKSPLCSLDATVASLTCLTASGGVGNNGITSGAAEVAGVKTALGLDPSALFTTSASSGPGSAPSILSAVAPAVPAAEAPRAAAVAPTAAPAATLPRTGVAALSA